jgi:hypothetical protein
LVRATRPSTCRECVLNSLMAMVFIGLLSPVDNIVNSDDHVKNPLRSEQLPSQPPRSIIHGKPPTTEPVALFLGDGICDN